MGTGTGQRGRGRRWEDPGPVQNTSKGIHRNVSLITTARDIRVTKQADGVDGTGTAESMDGWYNDLTQYESTLEAMATASLDQNFTDELGAIEQCECC